MNTCDICGRKGTQPDPGGLSPARRVQLDPDGLWRCEQCRARGTQAPIADTLEGELEPALQPLLGKSAGAICRTLELPYKPPYQEVIDAATRIAYDEDRYMSAWSFLNRWLDGTTVWLSEDGTQKAFVSPGGDIQIQD